MGMERAFAKGSLKNPLVISRSGVEALENLKRNNQSGNTTCPSIILLDYKLPAMDGLDVLSKIREKDPGIPVVFITGFAMQDLDQKALDLGVSDYLLKDDINESSLEKTVRYAIEKTKYLNKLRDTNQELVKSNRAKEDFFAAMSHELKTPLNAVINFAENLLKGIYGEVTEGQEGVLKRIANAGRHLNQIVSDIFMISELDKPQDSFKKEPCDLCEVVKFSISLCEEKIRSKDLSLSFTPLEEPVFIMGDRVKLQQLFINLLSNAAKFSDRGVLEIQFQMKGNEVEVKVADEGIGIPEEKLEEVFLPFSQADGSISRRFGGVGLGLCISKKVVEAHQGSIFLESQEGVGTQVFVTFPLADDSMIDS